MVVDIPLPALRRRNLSEYVFLSILERFLFIYVRMTKMRTMVLHHDSVVVALLHVDIY